MKLEHVEILAEAEAEIDEAIEWYLDRSTPSAAAFLLELRRLLAALAVHPRLGRPWPVPESSLEVRALPLKRFPYLLIYAPGAPLRVIAVAHTRRAPGYWQVRVH